MAASSTFTAHHWEVLVVLLSFLAFSVDGQKWDAGKGTELSCSIMVWGEQDYAWNISKISKRKNGHVVKNYTSHCMQSVRLARQRCGGKALNFVPTHFWKWQDAATQEPLRLCYKTNKGDDQVPVVCDEFVDWYPANRTKGFNQWWKFYKGMKGCFMTAIWEGFTEIKITPHLDDGTGAGGWRNTLGLDPWKQFEGWSYVDIMLKPLSRALYEAMTDTKTVGKIKVMMTMQGEMNYALAAYPDAWLGVMNQIRGWIPMPKGSEKMLKVGVSLNYNKLCGFYCQGNPTLAGSNQLVNIDGYKALLQQVEYLGISNYPSLSKNLGGVEWDFEGPIAALDEELSAGFGFGLNELMAYNDKEFHLSEFGVGGGVNQCGCQAGKSAAEIADYTFFGLFGTYGKYQDPWMQSFAQDFQGEFYKRALNWLGKRGGPRFRVDGAFIWCMSSWDVAGLYWTSYKDYSKYAMQTDPKVIAGYKDTLHPEGTYYKPGVMQMIKNWNDNRWKP